MLPVQCTAANMQQISACLLQCFRVARFCLGLMDTMSLQV